MSDETFPFWGNLTLDSKNSLNYLAAAGDKSADLVVNEALQFYAMLEELKANGNTFIMTDTTGKSVPLTWGFDYS